MAIRLSGINSGLDTDALVKELVSAYSLKTEKYEKQQTKLEWKKEAWQSLNTKIYGLYTSISNLRYDSAYNLKKTTVSDSTKATVTASSSAVTGTQKLNILSTAQACYITGGVVSEDIKGSTKLKELGVYGETSLTINKGDDTDVTNDIKITISADDTVSSLMQKMKDAGLNANFDENNQRIYLSAKESGSKENFSLDAETAEGSALLSALGLTDATQEVASINAQVQDYRESLTKLAAYTKTDEEYQADIDDYKAAEARSNLRKSLDNILEAAKDKKDFDADAFKAVGTGKEDIEKYLKDHGFTEDEIKKVAADITAISKSSAEDYAAVKNATLEKLNEAMEGLESSYNTATAALNLRDKVAAYQTKFGGAEPDDVDVDAIVNAATNAKKLATKIAGSDARIILNNVEYTSTSNSFNINGLTIEANVETGAGEANAISITTSVDNQGIYDKIKDFLTEYNSVINEITKLYNADSAKGYEPLTDEEKDAMSETQIEKWEDKIKDSLLRRDTSLGNVMNAMINSMSQTFEVNGQKLSLSNFGISTLGFLNAAQNEQYAYHIDGDEDDSNTSGKPDKLMAAIQTNPDQILDFMKQLTTKLYNSIDEKMKSTELSSVYKVYNDKEMDKEQKELEELIKKWEDKVAKEEEYYYNKFSDMEVALSKLQSQTSALGGLLGQ